MPDILEMTIQVSNNRIISEHMERVRNDIVEGRSLSYAIGQRPVFPRLLVQLARVGEETANLEDSLEAVAETYEAQVDKRVNTVVSLIEPSIILFVGLIVAFIAVSVIMPTYAILSEI